MRSLSPVLLSVMRYCAADGHHSLFSAATAHSTLHQAAVLTFNTSDFGIPAVLQDQHKVSSFCNSWPSMAKTVTA